MNYISKHSGWLGICQPTNGDLLKLLLHVGQRLSQAARWPVEDPESKIKKASIGRLFCVQKSSRSDSLAPGFTALGSESDRLARRHYFRETSFLCCQKCGGALLVPSPDECAVAVLEREDPSVPLRSQSSFTIESSVKPSSMPTSSIASPPPHILNWPSPTSFTNASTVLRGPSPTSDYVSINAFDIVCILIPTEQDDAKKRQRYRASKSDTQI